MTLISKEMNDAINAQITEELKSGYIYLGISLWAEERSLHNYAAWMKKQFKEEYEHAERFMNYIIETGGHVKLNTIGEVPTEYPNTEATIKATIEHEEFITKKIRGLLELAYEKKEYEAIEMLQWFVHEQIEEESQSNELMATYELQGKKDGLWDHHLHRD
ncbi:ferritin [Promethearchaeum syntrophicum]|uniref:Ferritin n=1 Tax=Promethearchaeum syntrophicum TaxID=2594042 RepID=A0A5B9D9J3_9ARCH|nr:ferritin [Candidatus Prometheoarchaeum syntrophicum]QEE15266.1 ferritin [Candidatus Prometheoarchaeum syntrophicum]